MKPKFDRLKIRELYDKGMNDYETARQIGASNRTICSWRQKNQLSPHGRHSCFDWEKARQLYDQGKSDGAIAKELGCHFTTVYQWRKKNKLKPNYQPVYSSELQDRNHRIIRLYKRKKSIEEICATMKLPYQTVSITIGRHLMQLCRKEPACPMKALLPETEVK